MSETTKPVASHWSVIRFAFNEALRVAAKGLSYEEQSAALDELARKLDDNIREHAHPAPRETTAPVAWGITNANGDVWDFTANPDVAERWTQLHGSDRVVPLYAHPAPRGRVVVTEAMVKAALTVYEPILTWEEAEQDTKDYVRDIITAALALVDADAGEVAS